ncbi:MAG TPA: hypothetical protein VKP30_33735 [Polyangiaceae bacterium]|nr:hypothetical protein [Polyangiaceae bacterium]
MNGSAKKDIVFYSSGEWFAWVGSIIEAFRILKGLALTPSRFLRLGPSARF